MDRRLWRAKLSGLRRAVKDARTGRRAAVRQVRELCRSGRVSLRERQAAERVAYREAQKAARAQFCADLRAARIQARTNCAAAKDAARSEAIGALELRRRELEAEKAQRAEELRIRRIWKGGPEKKSRRKAIEAIAESDDAVLRDIDPGLAPVWEKVKREIRGTARLSRTEAFLHWLHDNADEAARIIADRAEHDVEARAAELEAEELAFKRYEAERKKGGKLPGGRGDLVSPAEVDPGELAAGTAHEREHTSDPEIAQEIAIDHLAEDPAYYSHLSKMEAQSAPSARSRAAAERHADLMRQGFMRETRPRKRARAAAELYAAPKDEGERAAMLDRLASTIRAAEADLAENVASGYEPGIELEREKLARFKKAHAAVAGRPEANPEPERAPEPEPAEVPATVSETFSAVAHDSRGVSRGDPVTGRSIRATIAAADQAWPGKDLVILIRGEYTSDGNHQGIGMGRLVASREPLMRGNVRPGHWLVESTETPDRATRMEAEAERRMRHARNITRRLEASERTWIEQEHARAHPAETAAKGRSARVRTHEKWIGRLTAKIPDLERTATRAVADLIRAETTLRQTVETEGPPSEINFWTRRLAIERKAAGHAADELAKVRAEIERARERAAEAAAVPF